MAFSHVALVPTHALASPLRPCFGSLLPNWKHEVLNSIHLVHFNCIYADAVQRAEGWTDGGDLITMTFPLPGEHVTGIERVDFESGSRGRSWGGPRTQSLLVQEGNLMVSNREILGFGFFRSF